MTERPEERDSLTVEQIIEQLDLWRSEPPTAGATDYRELAMSLRNSKVLFALAALPALRTLINEVKELREERNQLAPLIAETHDALPALKAKLARAEQMEEALREVLPLVVVRNGQGDRAVLRAAQLLALSPSDTEEKA